VALNGNVATYTPALNYCGPDSFAFTATDPCGNVSTPANVAIDVLPVNDPPTCIGGSATTCEDEAVQIVLTGNDPDIGSCQAESLTFVLVDPPAANGDVIIAADIATYTPDADYNGPDAFSFKVVDAAGAESGACTVDITVEPGNDPPVAVIEVMPTVDLGPNMTGVNVMSPNNIGACVTLDGTQSSDIDNDFEDLSFTWVVDDVVVGTGPVLTDVCLLVGENAVTLIVEYGIEEGGCDELGIGEATEVVTVILGSDAMEQLTLLINAADVERKNKQPFLASAKNAAAAFERGSFGAGVNMLEALINKFEAQLKANENVQKDLIDVAQSIIDGMTEPVDCEGCMEE
jgi:hypothetical protein